jgi:rhodanese-related sulfurtransferase
MKELRRIIGLLLILPILFIYTGCDKDSSTNPDPDQVNEFAMLLNYLENDGGNYINTAAGGQSIRGAAAVKTNFDPTGALQYIIDIRSATDFATGHIEGAVNVALKDIITHVEGLNPKPQSIVVACYTGQTSAYAVTFLRLLGHNNTYSMGFGMSSWHTDFANGWWLTKLSNQYAGQFESTNHPKGPEVGYPSINTGKSTPQEILRARINELLELGFTPATITASSVFASLNSYYIVNYWPNALYLDPGHIPGAINYLPNQDLHSSKFLKTIPTDKPSVFYCYTGQGSAFVAAYMRVLGYDTRSLVYGGCNMIYDLMLNNSATAGPAFKNASIMNYEYVTGP